MLLHALNCKIFYIHKYISSICWTSILSNVIQSSKLHSFTASMEITSTSSLTINNCKNSMLQKIFQRSYSIQLIAVYHTHSWWDKPVRQEVRMKNERFPASLESLPLHHASLFMSGIPWCTLHTSHLTLPHL